MKCLRLAAPALSIFGLALLVRVSYNSTVAHTYYPLNDSLAYQTIGFNIIKEHCFCWQPYVTTVYRAPLWPALIAGISLVLGSSDYYARLFLSCIDSGTCVLIYLFAKDLFGWRVGILAGVVAAFYPGLYIYDGWLYTEALYTFLLLAFCYGVYRFQGSPKRSRWIWCCGILLGLLSLTRPNGLFVLGLFIVWALIMGWRKILSWGLVTRSIIFISLISLAVVTPWTIRNYIVSHAFIPVATGDGTVLLGAYNTMTLTSPSYAEGNIGTWIKPLESTPAIAKPFPISTCDATCEVAREDSYRQHAEQWIGSHIGTMPYLLTLHFFNMWQPDIHEADLPTERFPDRRSSQIVLAMMKTFPIPIFLLAAFGLVVTLWKWRELLFMYGIILMTILQCLIFYGIPRFRAPIEPVLILLAVGAVWWLTQRERGTLWWRYVKNRRTGTTLLESYE